MDWYKNYQNQKNKKTAQYNRSSLYTHPDVDYGNQFGNNYVNPVHIPNDPYHKQKEGKKREYDYFLDEKDRVRKSEAIIAINRLAEAVNDLAKSHRKLKNTISSDEYRELARLIKSIVVKDEDDQKLKAELLQAIQALDIASEKMKGFTLEALPDIYGILSHYVDEWVSKDRDVNIMERKYPKKYLQDSSAEDGPVLERKYSIDLK